MTLFFQPLSSTMLVKRKRERVLVSPPLSYRECEDCEEVIPQGRRRIRCKRCNKLICEFCFWHVHNLPQIPDVLEANCTASS